MTTGDVTPACPACSGPAESAAGAFTSSPVEFSLPVETPTGPIGEAVTLGSVATGATVGMASGITAGAVCGAGTLACAERGAGVPLGGAAEGLGGVGAVSAGSGVVYTIGIICFGASVGRHVEVRLAATTAATIAV